MIADHFYGAAAAEIAEGRFDRDLMARLFAQCKGNPDRTKAEYVATRAKTLAREARRLNTEQPVPTSSPVVALDFSPEATEKAVKAMRAALEVLR